MRSKMLPKLFNLTKTNTLCSFFREKKSWIRNSWKYVTSKFHYSAMTSSIMNVTINGMIHFWRKSRHTNGSVNHAINCKWKIKIWCRYVKYIFLTTEVRNMEISRVTQQLLHSKFHDFLAVFALAHSKINQIG